MDGGHLALLRGLGRRDQVLSEVAGSGGGGTRRRRLVLLLLVVLLVVAVVGLAGSRGGGLVVVLSVRGWECGKEGEGEQVVEEQEGKEGRGRGMVRRRVSSVRTSFSTKHAPQEGER